MGYCNRCGEISTAGKCRKCGGRPVASIATSGLGDGDTAVLVADRWQSQYANSILGFDTPTQKTPSPTRTSHVYEGLGKPRPLSVHNTCASCSKVLRHDTPSYLEEEAHYCRPCHIQIFSAGACATCERPVFKKRDPFVDHASKVWHKECFRCYGCLAPLGDDPMVDLKKRPCCEPCLMAQSGEAKAATASTAAVTAAPSPRPIVGAVSSTTSTPILSRRRRNSALKRTDSQLFNYYQRSLQSPSTTPPPLTPSSPVLSVCSSTSASPVSSYSGRSRHSPSPPPPVQRPGSPTKTCYQCHENLSNKSSRVKLSTPMGERWFHHPCLRCSGCQGPFTESEFVSEGDMIYHPRCRPAPAKKQQARRQYYPCYACNKSITDRMLKNGTRYYHSECFRCHECQVTLPADQAFYEINSEPYCEPCSSRTPPSPITTRSTPFRDRPAPPSPSPLPLATSSSSVIRPRALPKLGGAKICPKCRQSIAIMDDAPGPRASRWHKKCLQCAGCRKQMDSGAKVIEGPTGEWLVKCRACLSSRS